MRKNIVIIILTLIALVLVLSFDGKVNAWSKTDGYHTYTNNQYGFSLDYPIGWYSTDLNTDKFSGTTYEKNYDFVLWRAVSPSLIYVEDVDKVGINPDFPGIPIAGVPSLSVIQSPLDNTRTSLIAEASKVGLGSVTVLSDKNILVKGVTVAEIIFTYVNNDSKIAAKQFTALGGKSISGRVYKGYGIVLSYPDSGRMIYIICIFDPTTYDEKFAQDILHNITFSSSKDIKTFNFPEGAGTIVGTDISVQLPYGTSVLSLTPIITVSEGATVNPKSGVAKNFTFPVNYTVTAMDLTTKIYQVTVTVAKNPAKEITSFGFVDPKAEGRIDEEKKIIDVVVPKDTDLTKLVAIFSTTGKVVEVDAVEQKSGETSNDFTKPLIYRVIAEDDTYQEYIVNVGESVEGGLIGE